MYIFLNNLFSNERKKGNIIPSFLFFFLQHHTLCHHTFYNIGYQFIYYWRVIVYEMWSYIFILFQDFLNLIYVWSLLRNIKRARDRVFCWSSLTRISANTQSTALIQANTVTKTINKKGKWYLCSLLFYTVEVSLIA